MLEIIFLFILGLIFVMFAMIQDLKQREIANWLNFSLIIFALGFRFFYSLFNLNFNFFYQGLIGLGIFFILGNLLYYGRLFAGGDAKLMIALGPIIGVSGGFYSNLRLFLWFLFIFLIIGGIYGILWSIYLALKNRKKFTKEFSSIFCKNRKLYYLIMVFGLIYALFGFRDLLFLFSGILVFLIPLLFIFAKTVDKIAMIKNIKTKDLVEGDLLYKNMKIGNKIIKAHWEGLSKKDINFLKKKIKSVRVREGVPFAPVFFITYLLIFIFYFLRII